MALSSQTLLSMFEYVEHDVHIESTFLTDTLLSYLRCYVRMVYAWGGVWYSIMPPYLAEANNPTHYHIIGFAESF